MSCESTRTFAVGETDLRMAIEGMRGFAKSLRAVNAPYADGMAQEQTETAERLESAMESAIESCRYLCAGYASQ